MSEDEGELLDRVEKRTSEEREKKGIDRESSKVRDNRKKETA